MIKTKLWYSENVKAKEKQVDEKQIRTDEWKLTLTIDDNIKNLELHYVKLLSDDLPVKWTATQITSKVLPKEISKKNQIPYSIIIEIIKANSNVIFGFSTSIFSDFFGKAVTQKY